MFQQAWQLFRTTLQVWSEAKSSRMSAAMTYYTMLSLAPMLMIAIAIAAQFYCSQQVKEQILDYVRDVASPQVATTFSELIDKSSTRQSGLVASMISIGVLLFGASGIFTQLFETFNDIWKVPVQKRSGLRFSIRNRLVGVVMVLSVGGLLIATLALSSVIASISQLLDGNYPRLISWLSLADRGLSFILMPFVLSLMFWYFPAKSLKWIDVLPAAGLTAVLLACSRYLIDFYLRLSTASEVYGAAGSLVLFLVWIYLTGMIVFFGAAFSCAWTRIYGSHANITDHDLTHDDSILKGIQIKGIQIKGVRLQALAGIGRIGSSFLNWNKEAGNSVDNQPIDSNSATVSSSAESAPEIDHSTARMAVQKVESDLNSDRADAVIKSAGAEPDRVAFSFKLASNEIESRSNSRKIETAASNPTRSESVARMARSSVAEDGKKPATEASRQLQPTRRHWSVAVAREMRDLKQDDLLQLQTAIDSVESRIASEYSRRLASKKKSE